MIAQNTASYAAIENPDDARIPPLLSCLAGGDPVMRAKSHEALAAIGKPAVPSLIQLLSNRRPLARWEAAKVLADIADPLSATALVNALDDPDDNVRWVAAEGVIALGGDGLQALLAALLERSQSSWFRLAAHHVCRTLAAKRKLGPILRPVLAAFNQFCPQLAVPLAAYAALAKLREEF